jgi:uncharacterized GH25 family protein
MRCAFLCATVVLTVSVQSASAHYLWIQVNEKTSTANLYFEGGPGPGDGKYLDPFIQRGKMWLQTANGNKPTEVKMTEVKQGNKRWLKAGISKNIPRSVDSYGKWGVYRYGKIDVLLHYYARNISVKSHDQLAAISKAPHLGFAIEPRYEDEQLVIRVVFAGKPAVGKKVSVRGPKAKHSLTTDKNGEARFKVAKPGLYQLRAYNQQTGKSGEFEGKKYQQVRHHSTLLITVP